ncbi:MAG: hypothetical protein NTY42_24185 [Planctomycetota bacterium]|nr:hypothetical protein [Planctomycetota bacterium]
MNASFNKFICICLLLTMVVGCRGCNQQTAKTKDPEEEKKKLRITSEEELRTLPFSKDTIGNFHKPSHWYQANHKLKANQQDESLTAKVGIFSQERKLVPTFPGTSPMEFQRSLAIGKDQEKNIALKFYQPDVPVINEDDRTSQTTPSYLAVNYSMRGVGTTVFAGEYPAKLMPGYQYNIVSISVDPARYVFWRGLDCIVWPSQKRMPDERIHPHRMTDLNEDEIASQFPEHLYSMTSISHLVINDASPSRFSTEQQNAILDWLYFGGTIIINGSDAIGGVSSSFLKELSPLNNTAASSVTEEEIERLNEDWTIKQYTDQNKSASAVPFSPAKKIPKLEGALADGASWVNSLNGLVAEKLIGQGRVVMTTFPMTDNTFIRWPSYSSFIHNAILRKHPRDVVFIREPGGSAEADTKFAGMYSGSELNPIHSTRLRIWARDLDSSTMSTSSLATKKTSLGAWNPQSAILLQARQSLQQSSGITVPKIETIVKLLVGYLIILVPINWLVFRLLGKVELAWVAAPIIAIVGAFVVARGVQLDVGFSRSQTEYGFLECHAGHPRGVLSTYSALYTSLSTNYRATFENENGVVTPMPSPAAEIGASKRIAATKYEYTFADDAGSGLQSTTVLSNTTGLLQSEETVQLGGNINTKMDASLLQVVVTSDSTIDLKDFGVLGIDPQGRLVKGWLGSLEKGTAMKCDLKVQEKEDRWFDEWNENVILSRPDVIRSDGINWTSKEIGDELYLGALLEKVSKGYPLAKGEYIAIGWTDNSLSTLNIAPIAKQKKQRNLVLLHLRAGDLPKVSADLKIHPIQQEETDEPLPKQ